MAKVMYSNKTNRFLRGEITSRWQEVTPSEIEECCVDRSKLVEILQTHYGYVKRRAEKEADLFYDEFQDRLRMTA